MPINGVQGSAIPVLRPQASTSPATQTAAPQPAAAPKGTDRLSLSGTSPLPAPSLADAVARAQAASGAAPKAFDVEDTSERLIAHHQGSLDNAYYESINIRNTTKEPGYAAKLSAYSQKLGMDRDLTPDELRDVEHYLFAAASTADQRTPGPDASYLERAGAVLAREPYAVGLAAATVGYSAAKVVNSALPDSLKFLRSRTAPSLEEVGAGLKGIWRGMKDKV